MMKKYLHSNKGFTIVESLIAIAILVAVIAGAMTATTTALSSYTSAKYEVIATYMAQEGIEQIRSVRDENRLNSRDWLVGIADEASDPCFFGNTCTVSPVEQATTIACGGGCPVLRQQVPNGFYGYNALWTATPFTRSIELSQVNANEVEVKVTISWKQGVNDKELVVRENLLNWQ